MGPPNFGTAMFALVRLSRPGLRLDAPIGQEFDMSCSLPRRDTKIIEPQNWAKLQNKTPESCNLQTRKPTALLKAPDKPLRQEGLGSGPSPGRETWARATWGSGATGRRRRAPGVASGRWCSTDRAVPRACASSGSGGQGHRRQPSPLQQCWHRQGQWTWQGQRQGKNNDKGSRR